MKIHIVKKGESLYLIGQKYNVTLEEILKLNPGITNPDAIEIGMKVKIPSSHPGSGGGMDIMHQHVVKQGDTLWKLSKSWGVPLADMIKANPQLKNPNVLLTGEIVNIPKVGTTPSDVTGLPGTTVAQSAGNQKSLMQNVQGWVGKLSTAPIIGKTPTGPATTTPGKTSTAPAAGKTPTAPIVTPTPPAPLPAPPPAAVKPAPEKTKPAEKIKPAEKTKAAAEKTLPIEKPVEKKLSPIHSEYQPNVDLFKQYGIPATEAMSLYDLPKAPEAVSPAMQQPFYGGYGNGYGQPMVHPAQMGTGYGNWQQPTPFSPMVSPAAENAANALNAMNAAHAANAANVAPLANAANVSPLANTAHAANAANVVQAANAEECPPGMVMTTGGYGYGNPFVSPQSEGPWGYGAPMVSPFTQGLGENNSPLVAGASTLPEQDHYGHGMVSPASLQPEYGHYGHGMVSPASVQPEYGHYGYGGMVSPASVQPEYGYYGQGAVSPASMQPDYGYGGAVSPIAGGHGYYTPYPTWPQTAGAGTGPSNDCGCGGEREPQVGANVSEINESPIGTKPAVAKKSTKKAVIRTISTRSSKPKSGFSRPWINR